MICTVMETAIEHAVPAVLAGAVQLRAILSTGECILYT
jgi:hypothetical protein